MLLTKRAPVSEVFTYKKLNLHSKKITSESISKPNHQINNGKSNLLKAMLCVSILKSNFNSADAE